jgi:hypothetical protein
MQQKLVTTRWIAGVLGVLLVIAIIIIWNDHKTITALEAPARQNITAQRDIIREDCTATDADSRLKCADDLQSLSDLLAQFSKTIHTGSASSTLPVQSGVSNVQLAPIPTK